MFKMYRLYIITFVYVAVFTAGERTKFLRNDQPVDFNSHSDSRIVGGKEIKIEEVPYFALVEGTGSFWLGGTIINKNHVLTVAYYVDLFEADELLVRVGSDVFRKNGTEHNVTEIRFHDLYNHTFAYDIALLTITPDIELDNTKQNISLIEDEPVSGTNATIVGFGSTNHDFYITNQYLRATTIEIIDRDSCEVEVEETEICGGSEQNSPCFYDQGGPLVVDGLLAGIIDYSMTCGYPGNISSTFTSIALIRDWIQNNV